ncbi:MAG: DUF4236 domain-containing protein, partial [Deltaproteobacteria bacterium]|nr:DUF4236 domain-containing protein [Deltaproteobacteria bacterium]
MAFRFWRRIRIAPGVTLNLSKSGGSLSFGSRGAKFTVGSRGKRAAVGLPGTGLFYTSTFPSGKRTARKAQASRDYALTIRPEDRLTLGFFKRIITPDDEQAFVDRCSELALGNEEKALEHLKKAVHLADGAYLAGFLALKKERLEEAANYLATAAEKHSRLGRYFSKYGISATMSLPITDLPACRHAQAGEVSAHVGPDLRGVLLGLVEAYQRQERWQDAIACLERLRRLEPDDVVVKLSLAELLLDLSACDSQTGAHPSDLPAPRLRQAGKNVCQKVVRLVEGIENETPIHAALMLYKAKALRHLGLATAARDTLTAALRRK